MKHICAFLFLALLLGCSSSEPETDIDNQEQVSVGEFIDDWSYNVNPTSTSNFDIAAFRLWVPENTSNLKAILVLASSSNSNALGLADSEEWQKYAVANNLAIISVHLKSSGTSGYYAEASGGSGKALLTALEKITERNNISAIADLPFLLRGYSAGGVFSYFFSAYKPERVIAFANIRGGGLSVTSDSNKLIPGMMLIGELDTPSRNETMKSLVQLNRNNYGLWSYVVEPKNDHFGSLKNSDELIKLFFTSVLAQRVSKQNNELLTLSESSGWLGDNVSKNLFSYNDYPGYKNLASWLITEEFANSWKDYQLE